MSFLLRNLTRHWRRGVLSAAVLAGVGVGALPLFAQGRPPAAGPNGRYPIIHQNMPVGDAARFNTFRDPSGLQYFQPVRLALPGAGQVSLLRGPRAASPPLFAPAQIGLMVGHTYRFKISEMPDYPGVELYPSVEVLDRLHPPRGLEHNFPVPLELTHDEIELVLDGRLVTKVIYLEQPQVAAPGVQATPLEVAVLPGSANLLTEADRTGRPLLLLRIGGRIPDPNGGDLGFYGTGAPAVPSVPKPVEPPPAAPPAASPETEAASPQPREELVPVSATGSARLRRSTEKTPRTGAWVSTGVTIPVK